MEFAGYDGVFNLSVGPHQIPKYKVCGEDQLTSQRNQQVPGQSTELVNQPPRYPVRPHFTPRRGSSNWNAEFSSLFNQRQLADMLNDQTAGVSSLSTPLSKRSRATGKTDSFWKRTIPYVTLGIEGNGKSLFVESTEKNLFLKLPESQVSAASIVTAASSRISNLQDELLLLDSKFIPISTDDATGYSNFIAYYMCSNCLVCSLT